LEKIIIIDCSEANPRGKEGFYLELISECVEEADAKVNPACSLA
jgi:hypothetical protein